MRTFIMSFMLIILPYLAFSQCGEKLVEAAMAQNGPDAIFVREFSARLSKGSVKNPLPLAKYNVFLKVETKYRFNVLSDQQSNQEAVLQLYYDGKLLGSTMEGITGSTKNMFNFTAPKTGSYQVIISLKEGNAGCVAGILSFQPDLSTKQDSVIIEKYKELDVIYLGIENPISIETDKETSDTMILNCDNGIIREQNGSYYVVPESEGIASVKVIIRNKAGKIKEEAQSDLLVKRLPFPVASVHGLQGGIISSSALQIAERVDINYPIDFENYGYKIVDFLIKFEDVSEKRIQNSGEKFSPTTRNHLSNLKIDSRLIFDSIHVLTPGGQIITLEPLAFIVR
jgi:hypothetical protein